MIIHPSGVFDNKAQPYEHIVVAELAAAMGAEVKGVELSRVTDAQFAEIEQAPSSPRSSGGCGAPPTRWSGRIR